MVIMCDLLGWICRCQDMIKGNTFSVGNVWEG